MARSGRGRGTGRTPSVTGTGLIVQAGTLVTGTNTLFQSEVAIGDRIVAGAIDGLVVSIASNVSLTLNTSAIVSVAIAFTIWTG